MSREIPLNKGYVAIVDDEDYERISRYHWFVRQRSHGLAYAMRNSRTDGRCTTLFMHTFVLNAKAGQEIDHINSNGLDNRKENLRLCTHQQNSMNIRKFSGTSKFKGVHRRESSNWGASIRSDGKTIWLGTFEQELDAAKAYDIAARRLFGEFARTNFQ